MDPLQGVLEKVGRWEEKVIIDVEDILDVEGKKKEKKMKIEK